MHVKHDQVCKHVCVYVCEAVGDTLVREEGGNRSPLGGNQQMAPHWRNTDQDRLKHDGRCFEGEERIKEAHDSVHGSHQVGGG